MPLPRRGLAGRTRPLSSDDDALSNIEPMSPKTADACYQAALRLLGYRSRTESEMRQRLSRKGFGEAEIETAVVRLKAAGLIDDAAFAKAWSDSRTAGSPRSAYIIKRELKTKGIETGIADEAILAVDDGEAAYRAVQPRLKHVKPLPPEEARRKLADFLRRRGFGWNVIERTLSRLQAEGFQGETEPVPEMQQDEPLSPRRNGSKLKINRGF